MDSKKQSRTARGGRVRVLALIGAASLALGACRNDPPGDGKDGGTGGSGGETGQGGAGGGGGSGEQAFVRCAAGSRFSVCPDDNAPVRQAGARFEAVGAVERVGPKDAQGPNRAVNGASTSTIVVP